ncbi:hypothetical protein [Sphingomonas albertensis]|uniref:Hpr(Ser) kinase/phosphatase n=1 Tax=Sphingomonas albertensis TaxID=2762591 RepID=A0ABR7ALC6_9SPHN|nr:hypothetical protein [Sphingomonas albertensis]MBC3941261.1 hypothetical protein [Sphingomonas albertensis]
MDVDVRLAPAPPPDAPEILPAVRVDANHFWMDVPRVGRFLVRNGREMIVEPCPGAPDGDVRAYLLGSAMGALLQQRGLLPLHASAVAVDGRAVAFIAPAGSGKSTIAMHLQHRGHRVICDDICAVEVGDGVARLRPGLRNLKLWRASLGAIARTPDGLEPVLADMDKYRVPVDAPTGDRVFDLAAVVLLGWGEEPAIASLPGAEAVGALIANTFRGQLVAPMGRQAAHWRQCLDLFNAAGVHRLVRPRALDRLAEASALVERLSLDMSR